MTPMDELDSEWDEGDAILIPKVRAKRNTTKPKHLKDYVVTKRIFPK
jgi:hypothetical protein